MMKSAAFLIAAVLALPLAACDGAEEANVPGDASESQPFAGIGESEAVHFTGTEPFWGGQVAGGSLTYTTPENAEGVTIPVTRFAGRGGVGFSGQLDGAEFDLAISQEGCSDGMSDRVYPFAATLKIAGEQRNGCAWSDGHPFTGPENP